MKAFLKLAAMVVLAGCSTQPQTPAPLLPPPVLSGSETAGEKATIIARYCANRAQAQCPAGTIYCNSFQGPAIRSCMIGSGVSPEYVTALMGQ